MKTPRFPVAAAVVLAALCIAGCSTPESRIRKNPEVFARLTPAQQDMIRKGQVGIGFTEEMVQLALGEPDQIRTRTDANGVTEIWSYTTYEGPDGMILYRGWYHRYYYWGDPLYPYYLSYPYRREHEHFRVTFRDGKVISVEERKQ
ncbi:MAG TPA: hypothetical protein VLW52_04910 [Opitutaceae bacterium]|nr:hypothetical protein [Opitutaceae bacterium]